MSPFQEIVDILLTVVVAILTALLITSIFILFMIYVRSKKFYKPRQQHLWKQKENVGQISDVMFIKPVSKEPSNSEMELNVANFGMCRDLDTVLHDEQWLNDISEITPHCLGILKSSKSLTERLATLAMGILNTNGAGLKQIVDCARQISTRIDDLVATMYPPLNHQLLEARATSLTLAVKQLAIIARYEGRIRKIPMDWMDSVLDDMESHITVLREASASQDVLINTRDLDNSSVSTINFT